MTSARWSAAVSPGRSTVASPRRSTARSRTPMRDAQSMLATSWASSATGSRWLASAVLCRGCGEGRGARDARSRCWSVAPARSVVTMGDGGAVAVEGAVAVSCLSTLGEINSRRMWIRWQRHQSAAAAPVSQLRQPSRFPTQRIGISKGQPCTDCRASAREAVYRRWHADSGARQRSVRPGRGADAGQVQRLGAPGHRHRRRSRPLPGPGRILRRRHAGADGALQFDIVTRTTTGQALVVSRQLIVPEPWSG